MWITMVSPLKVQGKILVDCLAITLTNHDDNIVDDKGDDDEAPALLQAEDHQSHLHSRLSFCLRVKERQPV